MIAKCSRKRVLKWTFIVWQWGGGTGEQLQNVADRSRGTVMLLM